MLPKCSYCLRKIFEFPISCEQCVNVVLCHDLDQCFRCGAECGKHKRSHKYSIQEFDNDAETTLCQIRHEFGDDPLFRELVLARIDMFVERLRRRHQCHVIASKLNLLTHFMPDLRPLAAPGVGGATKTLPGKRLASQSRRSIGSSPNPSDSHSSIGGVCNGDVIDSSSSSRRTVCSANHKRRHPTIRGSARTNHLKRLRLEVERRTARAKETALARLTQCFSPSQLFIPASSADGDAPTAAAEPNSVVSPNPSRPSPHHSPVITAAACTPGSTDGDQVGKGENEAPECNNILPAAGEDYHDSGLGSSECSLHSTFSFTSTENSTESAMPALSKQQPSPLKGDQEIEISEQACCSSPPSLPNAATFELETAPRRRHSHPLISPHLLHTDPVFGVSNARLSCSRENSVVSTASSVGGGVPKKPTPAHVFPDYPRRAKWTRGSLPNPKSAQTCCTPRCIAEPLKPFLRFLSASEAHVLLTELHREHILRQQVDQLEQLRLAGSDNLQNVRLDGTKLGGDSDSDDSVESAESPAMAAAAVEFPPQPTRLTPPDPKKTPSSPSPLLRPAVTPNRQPAGKTASAAVVPPPVFRRPRGRPPLHRRGGLPSRLDGRAAKTAATTSSKQNSCGAGGYRRSGIVRGGGSPASISTRLSRGGGGGGGGRRRASLLSSTR